MVDGSASMRYGLDRSDGGLTPHRNPERDDSPVRGDAPLRGICTKMVQPSGLLVNPFRTPPESRSAACRCPEGKQAREMAPHRSAVRRASQRQSGALTAKAGSNPRGLVAMRARTTRARHKPIDRPWWAEAGSLAHSHRRALALNGWSKWPLDARPGSGRG